MIKKKKKKGRDLKAPIIRSREDGHNRGSAQPAGLCSLLRSDFALQNLGHLGLCYSANKNHWISPISVD